MTELSEKIDNWLIAKDFPTSVPYEMKLLAFVGEKFMPQKEGCTQKAYFQRRQTRDDLSRSNEQDGANS